MKESLVRELKGKIILKTFKHEIFNDAIFRPSLLERKNTFNSEAGEYDGNLTLSPCEFELKNNISLKDGDECFFDFFAISDTEEGDSLIKVIVRGIVLSIKSSRYVIDPIFYSLYVDDCELIHVERGSCC